jgi:protein O-mannosyl-transferase
MVTSRLFLAFAAVLLGWLALPGTFVFDDHSLFVDPAVVPRDAWRQWFQPTQTRPLTYLSFWADYHLWGHTPAGFRFTNLAIHLIAAALVGFLARRLVPSSAAIAAALLFALHPLSHEPLLYVFARSSSLSAVFALLALWCWLSARHWAAVAAFAISLLAKEEWVALPMALLLIDLARREKPHWPPLGVMLACATAAGARVIYATSAIAGAGSGFSQAASPWEYFLLQGLAIPGYLWRVLVPIRMPIDPARPELNLEAAILFWILLAAALAFTLWRRPPVESPALWLVIAAVLILPSSSILPADDAIAFRRAYLPLAAIAIAAALTLRARPRLLLSILAALALFAAVRRETWQSESALWRESLQLAPAKLRPHLQLARLVPPADAIPLLESAKQLAPQSPEVASEQGRVWLESGNAAQALAAFGRALALAPQEPRHLQNRGVALLLLGQQEAARADFERALQRDPCLRPARENLVRLGLQLPPPPTPCPTINSAAK